MCPAVEVEMCNEIEIPILDLLIYRRKPFFSGLLDNRKKHHGRKPFFSGLLDNRKKHHGIALPEEAPPLYIRQNLLIYGRVETHSFSFRYEKTLRSD